MLAVNTPFPPFALQDQDGRTRTLANYAGQWLVVYFYPKDDTPGCTIQGKGFTSAKTEYESLGATVLGVSSDDVASHKNFCSKFGFTHTLLADVDQSLIKACGVPQSEWKGTLYWDRVTFLVDPKGLVRKVYDKVNPEGHDVAVLEDIKTLKGEPR